MPSSPEEKLIGDLDFGFTAELLETAVKETRDQIRQIDADAEKRGGPPPEAIAGFIQGLRSDCESLLAIPSDDGKYPFLKTAGMQGLNVVWHRVLAGI